MRTLLPFLLFFVTLYAHGLKDPAKSGVLMDPKGASLVTSDGSPFKAPDFYPDFSWDVTPQYFMFGDSDRVLYPEEVRSIAARTGFICIEKSHGMKQLGARF